MPFLIYGTLKKRAEIQLIKIGVGCELFFSTSKIEKNEFFLKRETESIYGIDFLAVNNLQQNQLLKNLLDPRNLFFDGRF